MFPEEASAAAYAHDRQGQSSSPRVISWFAFEAERAAGRLDDPRGIDLDGRRVLGTRLERELDAALQRYRLLTNGPQGDDALSAYLRDPYGVTVRRLGGIEASESTQEPARHS